jgi:hypothetical protein
MQTGFRFCTLAGRCSSVDPFRSVTDRPQISSSGVKSINRAIIPKPRSFSLAQSKRWDSSDSKDLLSLSVTFFPFRISVMRLAQHNHVVEAFSPDTAV